MIDLLCCLFTRTFKLGKKKEKERIDLNRRLPLLLTTTTVSGQFRMDAPRLSSVYCAISSTRTFVQPGFFSQFSLFFQVFKKNRETFPFSFFILFLFSTEEEGRGGGVIIGCSQVKHNPNAPHVSPSQFHHITELKSRVSLRQRTIVIRISVLSAIFRASFTSKFGNCMSVFSSQCILKATISRLIG